MLALFFYLQSDDNLHKTTKINIYLFNRRFHSRTSSIINPSQKTHNKALIQTKWKLMATELRDSLIKLYLQIPYKNSLQLSPALQKLQQQFNNNSLIKYTWSAITAEVKNEVAAETKKEEKVVPKWKLNKSVISKVKIYLQGFPEFSKFILLFRPAFYQEHAT